MLGRVQKNLLGRFLFCTSAQGSAQFQPPFDQANDPTSLVKPIVRQQEKIQYNPWQAIQLVKLHSFAAFEETVDMIVRLSVNPKNGEQIVRGTAVMPAGTGKQITVAAIASEEHREACREAGADLVDVKEIMAQIKSQKIKFDKLFTTPDLLIELKQYAKILGPKGLMPNAKVGNLVTRDKMNEAIRQAKAGQVTFRVDQGQNIHAPIGKVSFKEGQLLDNMQSLMKTLVQKRPAAIKGKYFLEAYLKSTMGATWKLKIESIDPKHRLYLLNLR